VEAICHFMESAASKTDLPRLANPLPAQRIWTSRPTPPTEVCPHTASPQFPANPGNLGLARAAKSKLTGYEAISGRYGCTVLG
jgi:hypothetical protein